MKIDLGEFIHSEDLVFDVGAHCGTKAEEYLKYGARVVCFEPRWEACQAIWKLLGSNDNVMIVPVGLSDHIGCEGMWMCNQPGQSSMSPRYVGADGHTGEGLYGRDHWSATEYLVPVITMDTALTMFGIPNFIKLDTEDCEHVILSAMNQCVKALQFEFHTKYPDKIPLCVDRLSSLGFDQFNFHHGDSDQYELDVWVNAEGLKKFAQEAISRWNKIGRAHV